MTNPIFISIIIPHSNATIENDPLLPTLASTADQDGVQTELLLQHGGGIAGLWGKLSRSLNLSEKKDTVTLRVIEEKHATSAEALVAGTKRATGTWIGFLQPGEQYLPGIFASFQEATKAYPEIDIFLMGSVTSNSNKVAIRPAILPSNSYLTTTQPAWPAHSLFCRASLLRDDVPLESRYQHQMITEWLSRLLQAGKKFKILPFLATFIPAFALYEEEQKETLLPKLTGTIAFLKPWYQWRHQIALRQAEKAIPRPSTVPVYQSNSLTQRTNIG